MVVQDAVANPKVEAASVLLPKVLDLESIILLLLKFRSLPGWKIEREWSWRKTLVLIGLRAKIADKVWAEILGLGPFASCLPPTRQGPVTSLGIRTKPEKAPFSNIQLKKAQAAHLANNGCRGAFVCGTTGESTSFTVDERRAVADRWAAVAQDSLAVIVNVGHACLAMGDTGIGTGLMEPRMWLYVGLAFIAMGAGGIKPCVSANVGDQFGKDNQHLVSKIFSWFYFSINVGAMVSTLLIPVLLAKVGPWLAFGLPGVLMLIATIIFWAGRHRFAHVPAAGWKSFKEETFSRDGLRALLYLSPIFLIFIPMFWAIFDQSGSAWVIQAAYMDRNFLGINWLPSQVQAVNPFLILVLIPIFAYGLYPLVDKVFKVTPLRKISVGLFLTVLAFAISGWIQYRIDGGATPNIGWQFLAYVVLTAAEVMVSITSLEFAYTQAPKKMKSFIMGVYFLGISLGNLFTAGVNYFIQNEDGSVKLEGADYYWFFTGLMALTAVIFVFVAMFYKGQTYVQSEDDDTTDQAPPEGSGEA
ncbi:MAG: MFS transporter [Planctomycetes bacterium]|nr:MFS transporter [Planctomycetota bacterium]